MGTIFHEVMRYTRGIIARESIHAWKQLVVALNHAFDAETISLLLFVKQVEEDEVPISGDGLLRFAPLIAANLAAPHLVGRQGWWQFYLVRLTPKGQRLFDAWCSGDREQVRLVLTDFPPGTKESQN